MSRWTWGTYAPGAAYPEGWIRIEESPGATLVANLPPYRVAEAQNIVAAHNAALATDIPDCHGPTWHDGSCKHRS